MPTVLVVDDSLVDRRLAAGLLSKNPDIAVVEACDGKEGLIQIEVAMPDAVLTDLQMPEMNGLELVAAIRKKYPRIPVVLMTAQGSEEIAVQALQLGASSYVPKKHLAQDLLPTIERILASIGDARNNSRLMDHMTRTDFEFTLINDVTLIPSAVTYLREGVTQLKLCGEADRLRIGIAIEEALLNALFHGNLEVNSELRAMDDRAFYELAKQRSVEAPYWDRRIHVHAMFTRSEATFVIRDDGPGFDFSSLSDPTDPANLDRPYGRGVLLMRTFMHKVSYNETGNEVTLVKYSEQASEAMADAE